MLCQSNAPERATITDDVTFTTLCGQTVTRIKNIANPSVLLRTNSLGTGARHTQRRNCGQIAADWDMVTINSL